MIVMSSCRIESIRENFTLLTVGFEFLLMYYENCNISTHVYRAFGILHKFKKYCNMPKSYMLILQFLNNFDFNVCFLN